jgi:hypothetical protein
MALCVVPGRAEHKRAAEENLDIVVCPILRRERLEEHDDTLQRGLSDAEANKRYEKADLKVHRLQTIAPVNKKG